MIKQPPVHITKVGCIIICISILTMFASEVSRSCQLHTNTANCLPTILVKTSGQQRPNQVSKHILYTASESGKQPKYRFMQALQPNLLVACLHEKRSSMQHMSKQPEGVDTKLA